MAYRLIISERADAHIENIVSYVAIQLQNPGAADAILADIEDAYDKLEYMAESLAFCQDIYLAQNGYKKIILSKHDYVILYKVIGSDVHISGVFHMLENYADKL